MHFAYFESLSLQEDDKVIIKDRSGNVLEGYYKGDYIRSEFRFCFQGLREKSTITEISLNEIESMRKLN